MSKVKIPFVSLYTEETEKLLDPVLKEIRSAVQNSQFILSPKVSAFENRFKDVVGTRYAVGVNSGLDALILSLRSLGVGPGDEVITTPNSFLGSAGAIDLVGARTVFVDVRDDFNMDPQSLKSALTPKTKAVMPVHLTGNPCPMDQIADLCATKNIAILEDAAQAIGAKYLDKAVGSWGRVNAFSLHPLKNFHVWGDGGMITTDDQKIYENLILQRNHGLKNRDESEFFSYNSRLDSIQAIVGLALIETLDRVNEKRRKNAVFYRERLKHLSPQVKLPIVDDAKAYAVYHVFQLRVQKREALTQFLMEKGIETKVHYPIPIHLQTAAKHLGYKQGDFPVCERLSSEILSVPVRENLLESEIHEVCDAIDQFYRESK